MTRCAIYTRKSHEEGLEQEFNSLDAQRLAGENYIKSQQHEGWQIIDKLYDDGGFSGGTLERPALQQLFEDIASGLIDNDAFPDIVVSTTIGNSVYWLKNDGNGVFTLQSPEISTTLNSAGGVAIADLNGDGFNDVVTTSYNDNKLVWFANDGSGNFGSEQIISTTVNGPSQVYIRTLDNNSRTFICS